MYRGRFGGFSTVELVMVIAITAILAATAVPRFFEVGVFQDRTFYDQAIASVRYAQKLAVATRCPVRVTINAGGLALFRPANSGACAAGPYATAVADPANPQAAFTRTPPSGVAITTTADFNFTAAGGTAADVTVTVGSRSFRVHAATGFVQEL